MTDTASPCSCATKSSLPIPIPMPCSPVEVPPIAAIERVGLCDLARVGGVDQDDEVEITVADTTEQRDRHRCLCDVLVGGCNAFGKRRYRNAYVGRDTAAAGPQLHARKIRVVPRLPQARAPFLARGPFEIETALLGGDHLHRFRLLRDARVSAVEFAQQHRCHYVKARVRVHCYADGNLAVFHGPRKLADYNHHGKAITQNLKQAA